MTEDIALLEEWVSKAVDRLKRLSQERDDLEEEIRTLRSQLAGVELRAEAASDWPAQRAQLASVLRETVATLRGDSTHRPEGVA